MEWVWFSSNFNCLKSIKTINVKWASFRDKKDWDYLDYWNYG